MRAFFSRSRSRVTGFTIVELAAVLVVLMIVSTLAIRAWFGRSEVTLRNAAEVLVDDLRYLQTRATLLRAPVEVVFDTDGGGYHARELGGDVLVESARRYPQDAVFEDVHILGVNVPQGGSLVFDAFGHPGVDATILLSQRGVTRAVLVHSASGTIGLEGG